MTMGALSPPPTTVEWDRMKGIDKKSIVNMLEETLRSLIWEQNGTKRVKMSLNVTYHDFILKVRPFLFCFRRNLMQKVLVYLFNLVNE